jgi:hypothetical protein
VYGGSTKLLWEDYPRLRATLENPDIAREEPKPFEALIQFAVLVRLLSATPHQLVPPKHPDIPIGGNFEATETFCPEQDCVCIQNVVAAITVRFSQNPQVLQVVAVPIFALFPEYDVFLLRRGNEDDWEVVVGYQCKQGSQYPPARTMTRKQL